jgi:hypothetical protein
MRKAVPPTARGLRDVHWLMHIIGFRSPSSIYTLIRRNGLGSLGSLARTMTKASWTLNRRAMTAKTTRGWVAAGEELHEHLEGERFAAPPLARMG